MLECGLPCRVSQNLPSPAAVDHLECSSQAACEVIVSAEGMEIVLFDLIWFTLEAALLLLAYSFCRACVNAAPTPSSPAGQDKRSVPPWTG